MRRLRRYTALSIAVATLAPGAAAMAQTAPPTTMPAMSSSVPAQSETAYITEMLQRALKTLDTLAVTEQRTAVRTKIASMLEKLKTNVAPARSEVDALAKEINAAIAGTASPTTKPATKPSDSTASPTTKPGSSTEPGKGNKPAGGTGSSTTKPATGTEPGKGTKPAAGSTSPGTQPSNTSEKDKATELVERLQRALTLLSTMPATDTSPALTTRVNDMIAKLSTGIKPLPADVDLLLKDLRMALQPQSGATPGSSPTPGSGSMPGQEPEGSPSNGQGSSQTPPSMEDMVERFTRLEAVLTLATPGTERDALLAEVSAILAEFKAGTKPAPDRVRAAIKNAAALLQQAQPKSEEGPKQPKPDQVKAKVTKMLTSAITQLSTLTTPEAQAASAQASEMLTSIAAGTVPTKEQVDVVMAAVHAALGGKPSVRASLALTGVIAAMEASDSPDDVKAAVTAILREALAKVEADPSVDNHEMVKATLEQARDARVQAMTSKLTELITTLRPIATERQDMNSLVALDAAEALLSSEVAVPTRDELMQARALVGSVLERLKTQAAPVEPTPTETVAPGTDIQPPAAPDEPGITPVPVTEAPTAPPA